MLIALSYPRTSVRIIRADSGSIPLISAQPPRLNQSRLLPPKKEEGREKFKLASFPVFMTDGLDKVTEVRDYLSLINSNIEHVHRLQDLS